MNYNGKSKDYEKAVENSIREENDNLIGKISSNIGQFKKMNHHLNTQINSTNQQTENMQEKFSKSATGVRGHLSHLATVVSRGQGSICWFIVCIFIAVFFIRKLMASWAGEVVVKVINDSINKDT
mmetsp:Transcript_33603/g.34894  ORF Transcript_33603/g.34894 Transcript_33603/m.34894 type:complete len:125 (+) Transcript_33603:26-400(+)